MSGKVLNVGIIGAGWPGQAHARGYAAAGGFKLAAVADLIPDRRDKLAAEFSIPKVYPGADELLKDPAIEVVSLCLPTHMHVEFGVRALKAGKHVLCEAPPAPGTKGAKQLSTASLKYSRALLFAMQRRFGGGELAAHQAIEKGYAGEVFHARAAWMRTRGIPIGTGWYTDKEKSGGGALLDLGIHMLDTAWHLLGAPVPQTVFALTHQRSGPPSTDIQYNVEDIAYALIKFDGGKTLELSTSWTINQPPSQNGTILRLNGTGGAIDVYTPKGAVLYRPANAKGDMKETVLPPPKLVHHAAMCRHFKACIGGAMPQTGGIQGVTLMKVLEALYKSAETGRSADVKIDVPGIDPDPADAAPAPDMAAAGT